MENVSRRDVLKAWAAGAALAGAGAAEAGQRPKGGRERANAPADTFDIVFEGGGIKGVAFAGAVEVFLGKRYKFRRLIGSSAGAIAATCLAAGHEADRLRELLTDCTDE